MLEAVSPEPGERGLGKPCPTGKALWPALRHLPEHAQCTSHSAHPEPHPRAEVSVTTDKCTELTPGHLTGCVRVTQRRWLVPVRPSGGSQNPALTEPSSERSVERTQRPLRCQPGVPGNACLVLTPPPLLLLLPF